ITSATTAVGKGGKLIGTRHRNTESDFTLANFSDALGPVNYFHGAIRQNHFLPPANRKQTLYPEMQFDRISDRRERSASRRCSIRVRAGDADNSRMNCSKSCCAFAASLQAHVDCASSFNAESASSFAAAA